MTKQPTMSNYDISNDNDENNYTLDSDSIDFQQITEYKMESLYEISHCITMGLINVFIMYIIFNS